MHIIKSFSIPRIPNVRLFFSLASVVVEFLAFFLIFHKAKVLKHIGTCAFTLRQKLAADLS
jgi:hypothetical protein